MTPFLLAGLPITHGRIQHPAGGAWSADVEIASSTPVTGFVALSLPGLALQGTVMEGGVSFERQRLRLVGGRGGLGQVVGGQHFYKADVRTIASYLLQGAGEQLAADADASVLAQELEHWQHIAGTCGWALDLLTMQLGTSWAVEPGGDIYLGAPGWADASPDFVLLQEDLVGRSWTGSTITGTVQPGTTLNGKKVVAVDHEIEGDRWRSRVRW